MKRIKNASEHCQEAGALPAKELHFIHWIQAQTSYAEPLDLPSTRQYMIPTHTCHVDRVKIPPEMWKEMTEHNSGQERGLAISSLP